MRIIPAIDIIDGKCVRLTKGDYSTTKIYNENPVEVAKKLSDNGIKYLHVVDLDGAKSNQIVNYKVLEKIVSETNLLVDCGLKADQDLKIAFESGANQITGGSIAVKNESLFTSWIERYGSEKIILGADCLNRKIATNGWLEGSELDVKAFIESYQVKGIQSVICTDISKDGMLEGPSIELYEELLTLSKFNLIASGGVATIDDLIKLKEIGCEGAIVGKAFYEGNITLKQLSELC